jgi:hypothetical protein
MRATACRIRSGPEAGPHIARRDSSIRIDRLHSRIAFAEEAAYQLLVAAIVPGLLSVLALAKARGETRLILLSTALLLFVLTYFASYFFFCLGCS